MVRRMDVTPYQHSDSIVINRPPADVYAIVSDVTRIGELSPVCQTASWDDPAQAGSAGAWFTGHNVAGERTWDTRCQVSVAQPDREFTWINHEPNGKAELVRWGFSLERQARGTKVTESWQVLPSYPIFVQANNPDADVAAWLDDRARTAHEGIAATLARLKQVAEASG
jgi:hypothetical protein